MPWVIEKVNGVIVIIINAGTLSSALSHRIERIACHTSENRAEGVNYEEIKKRLRAEDPVYKPGFQPLKFRKHPKSQGVAGICGTFGACRNLSLTALPWAGIGLSVLAETRLPGITTEHAGTGIDRFFGAAGSKN